MENNEEKKDYEIGYGRPPKEHQFKKGQPSPNKNGRPKKPKTLIDALIQALAKEILVDSNGKKTKMTALEALGTKLVNDALKGDRQARSLILKDYSHNIQLFDMEEDAKENEEMSKTKKYLSGKNLSPMDEEKVHMEAIDLVRHIINEQCREKK